MTTATTTRPASPKQIHWITKMTAEKAHDFTPEQIEAAKNDAKRASVMLDALFAAGWKPKAGAAPAVTEEGIYRAEDGTLIRARTSKNTGNLYGLVLIVTQDDGKHRGTWEYRGGVLRTITPANRLTKEQAADIGREFKFCIACLQELSDPKSVAAGIGPVCGKRV